MSTPISVRLDDDALRALTVLESAGLTRSDAIRLALIEAAQLRRRDDAVRAEVLALDDDEEDRRELQAVASLMQSLRAAG
jgi:antitoxin component of RelBE/YafQ-DinJ toxin-antitoxin module